MWHAGIDLSVVPSLRVAVICVRRDFGLLSIATLQEHPRVRNLLAGARHHARPRSACHRPSRPAHAGRRRRSAPGGPSLTALLFTRSVRLSNDSVECAVDGRASTSHGLSSLLHAGNRAGLHERLVAPTRAIGETGVLATLQTPIGFRVGVTITRIGTRVITASSRARLGVNRPGELGRRTSPEPPTAGVAEVGPTVVDAAVRAAGTVAVVNHSARRGSPCPLGEVHKPSQRVADPFCGTGTILLAARRREPRRPRCRDRHDRGHSRSPGATRCALPS